eukprot:3997159-Amphidinium_carterae.1
MDRFMSDSHGIAWKRALWHDYAVYDPSCRLVASAMLVRVTILCLLSEGIEGNQCLLQSCAQAEGGA